MLKKDKILLSQAITEYYTQGYFKRFSQFTNYWDESTIRDLVFTYTKTEFVPTVSWPLFDYSFTLSQSEAARDAFTQFLMEEIQNE